LKSSNECEFVLSEFHPSSTFESHKASIRIQETLNDSWLLTHPAVMASPPPSRARKGALFHPFFPPSSELIVETAISVPISHSALLPTVSASYSSVSRFTWCYVYSCCCQPSPPPDSRAPPYEYVAEPLKSPPPGSPSDDVASGYVFFSCSWTSQFCRRLTTIYSVLSLLLGQQAPLIPGRWDGLI
jgi:hypothetical protein